MYADTLATMLQLRRLTVENARSVLADILRQQDAAERELTEAERAICAATAHATDPGSDDLTVEAFGAWLPEGRCRAEAARAALDHFLAQAAQARTVLGLARTALEQLEAMAGTQRPSLPRAESGYLVRLPDQAGRAALAAR